MRHDTTTAAPQAALTGAIPQSLWSSLTAPDARDPLPGDRDVDVAIIGGGFTGLWTAWHLLGHDPRLRVVILEAEQVGFGASGRNGGWCSGLFPVSRERIAETVGRGEPARQAARQMVAAVRRSVTDIGTVVATERIECGWEHAGTVTLARSTPQLVRAQEEVADAHAWGDTDDDIRLLGAADASELLHATDVLGGTYTPHCATVQPLALVRGLADAVERRGGVIHEGTRVLHVELEAGHSQILTTRGRVRAETVIRATEGYTATLPGLQRAIAPVYSYMVATEPLSADMWEEIGLHRRMTFADYRHVIIYGQRTTDGRLAFGGRGAPYRWRSAIAPDFDQDRQVHAMLVDTLRDLFPVLAGVAITHTWGGPLGIPRDWFPRVTWNRERGLGWAGGYVGDGVAASQLAGQTLADLILGRDTEVTRLPWVNLPARDWEPEPVRWVGVNAGLRAMNLADASEMTTGRASTLARLMAGFVGQ